MNWTLHPGPPRECEWCKKSWDLKMRFGHSSYSVLLIEGTRLAWIQPNCWCFHPGTKWARHLFWNLWLNLKA